MVTLRPHQMLHLLVSRARQCQCGSEQRELRALAPGAADAPRRSVEVDAYVRASLVAEARRIADAGGPHLNQHQVLRVMLMRAVRCRRGAPHPIAPNARWRVPKPFRWTDGRVGQRSGRLELCGLKAIPMGNALGAVSLAD
jgi:hypothetical protein